MIHKYQDFILESVLNLINENYLQASTDFLDKLKSISKKNKIAKIIFELFDNRLYVNDSLPQNWINISSEDTISFISDTKAGPSLYSNDTPFLAKGRNDVKVGRFVTSLLNNRYVKDLISLHIESNFSFTPKDIEEFVNLYKSSTGGVNKKFRLVKGESIAEWYGEDKYKNEKGTLGNSCMRDVDNDYFNIYAENDKVCRLLIYVDGSKLLGRALVWKLQLSPCEAEFFMDRVYVSSDSDFYKFKDYADEQGWMYKNKMTSHDFEGLLFKYQGNPVFGRIEVQLKESKFEEYPYLDTLTFLDKTNKLLSNVGFIDGFILNDTEGGCGICDDCNGGGRPPCMYCDEGFIDCKDCNGDGQNECEECFGKGTIGRGKNKITCDSCNGTGYINCSNCNGEGVIPCTHCSNAKCKSCTGLEDYTKALILTDQLAPEYKKIVKKMDSL